MGAEVHFKCECCDYKVIIQAENLKNNNILKAENYGIFFNAGNDNMFFCKDHLEEACDFVLGKIANKQFKLLKRDRLCLLKDIYYFYNDIVTSYKEETNGMPEMREGDQDKSDRQA